MYWLFPIRLQKVNRLYDASLAPFYHGVAISSANDDEHHPVDTVKMMEAAVQKMNPHVKYLNDRDHGYLLLSLYPVKTKAQWYYVETLRKPDSKEFLGKTFVVEKGSLKLK